MSAADAPLHVVTSSDAVAEAALPPAAPAPQPPAAPAGPRKPVTVKLEVPIQAHGETITEVTLRPPKPGEMLGRDLPFEFDGRITKIDTAASGYFIELLGNIPRSSVLQLDPGDLVVLCHQLIPLFSPRGRAS